MTASLPSRFHRLGHTPWIFLKAFYRRFTDEDVLLLAGGVAFNGILCLIPMLLLVTSVVGIFLHRSHAPVHQQIDDALSSVFPSEPYARQIKAAIQEMIDEIARNRSTYGVSGIVSFIWTATSLFSSVRTVVNRIYRLRTQKLVYIRIVENIVLVMILTILFFVANTFTWLLQYVESIVREVTVFHRFSVSAVIKSIPFFASYLSALVMFYLVNRFIPDRGISSPVALVSAFTSTTLWWFASRAFGLYLTTFHSYSTLYGTYAFLLVFLIWIYYSSVVFIVGVIVGQLYRERRSLS